MLTINTAPAYIPENPIKLTTEKIHCDVIQLLLSILYITHVEIRLIFPVVVGRIFAAPVIILLRCLRSKKAAEVKQNTKRFNAYSTKLILRATHQGTTFGLHPTKRTSTHNTFNSS